MKPSIEIADKFLKIIDSNAEKFTFQIIEKKGSAYVKHGCLNQLKEYLSEKNLAGAGIFVTVNQTDFKGRKSENILKVRAVFADLDGAPIEPILECNLKPQIIVETSSGRYHAYWLVMGFELEQFRSVQKSIARRFSSDTSVIDLPRVMRVPGFLHWKGAQFQSRIVEANNLKPYSLTEIIDGLSLVLTDEKQTTLIGNVDINRPLADGERTHALTRFCGRYIKMGFNNEAILETLRIWNQRNIEQLDDFKLVDTLSSIRRADDQKKTANDEVIDNFNKNHAVVLVGSKCFVLREQKDSVSFLSFTDFKNFYCNRPPVGGKAATTYWLHSPARREYTDVVFDPSQMAANDSYNLWRGLAVEPAEGKCSLYLEHIFENIASADTILNNYILDWMADAVQNPSELPGVSLVLKGRQGTGKGVFATEFGALFGCHFKHVSSNNYLTGQFSGHLAEALLIYADEVLWAGIKQQEGAIKTLITEKTRFVEYKFKDAIQVRNYSRIIMGTNADWVVPASAEERRFCVIEVGSGRIQDTEYFESITQEMQSGGYEALLHFLLNRDLSKSDIRKFPKTQALIEQKELSFDPETQWWYSCLLSGSISQSENVWPIWISSTELYEYYSKEQVKHGTRYFLPNNIFFRKLKRLVPGITPQRKKSDTQGSRIQGYYLPSITDCRSAFSESLGQEINWDAT